MKWPHGRIHGRLAAFGVLSACWLAACGQGNQPFDGSIDPPPDRTCIDRDGDGYGVYCELGLDCDDADPGVNAAPCEGMDPCTPPSPGCPCELDGEVVECRTAEPVESPDGSRLCYAGTRTCEDGLWGQCLGMEPYDIGEQPAGDDDEGVRREPILGNPGVCDAAMRARLGLPPQGCDPACMYVHDCPAQPDLVPAVSSNLMYDPVGFTPPAVVLLDPALPGTFTRTIRADCGGYDEQLSWWTVHWNATVIAPQTFVIRVRTAATEAGLASATWRVAVNCPTVACVLPPRPDDRAFTPGNIRNALLAGGQAAPRQPWLQYQIEMRQGGAASSPQFVSADFFFFCDEAT